MKIVVIGSGAMGMLFGSRLALHGYDITMVDVVPAVIEKLNNQGLYLEGDDGDHLIPIKAAFAEDINEEVDLAILLTKAIYSRSALESAKKFLGKDTHVLTLQNGLGNIELISEYVPHDHIIAGVTNYPSDVKGIGHISSHGSGYTKIMSANGEENKMLYIINDALQDAGLNSQIAPDVMVSIWEKVAFNAAINATTAVCRIPCGGMAVTEQGKYLAYTIAKEAVAVANAHGVAASEETVINSLTESIEFHKDHFTSMSADIINKRKTENEFINGGIVKKAQEVNMEVPYTEALYDLICTIENTYNMQKLNTDTE
ncbi:2-dehydropantoate 2-reductase [Virgibacillus natechei]|uniref:2-dehydropantoate 2-reductase n=1 Tax=Virgibacillus natechei TaxID=1216297 RepID=A0ABS4ILF1_9BACI|nr:ketopantoate reductase family protein [Virgibacillus natechei]MBP1971708.1 2-dehydropantoate 2-reductase [Virgibacillus natechei]UZD12154.1 ketopantoate reductase family protein [Virgibacillus natechei]